MRKPFIKALCVGFAAALALLVLSCSGNNSSGPDAAREKVCDYSVTYSDGLMLVTPGDCNIHFDLSDGTGRTRTFYPTFNNNPSAEPVDTDYFFVVREAEDDDGGPSRNLLINFMGGGACWDGTNCLDYKTNYTWDDIKLIADNPALLTVAQQGVVLDTNSENPFQDWTLVYLPYTTGDVHWGSNDQEYTDADGVTKTVYHRGYDNFLAALRFLKDTYPPGTIDNIFVMGQSAGAYGAIFNFPYIRETYKKANAWCLGDGGMGVNPEAFVQEMIDHWKVEQNLCDWIPGISAADFQNVDMGSFYRAVAAYYPDCRFGQYTAKYDQNQRYFYYVMLEIDHPELWDDMSMNGYFVPDEVSCEWTEGMLEQIQLAAPAPNYQVFVAPGEVHTITTSEDMYDVSSGGVYFIDWLNQMLDLDPAWTSVECDETDNGCERPGTEDSPAGLVCDGITVFPVGGTPLVSGVFTQTEGIAFNSDGKLFVSADTGIQEIKADGTASLVTTGIQNPVGLAPAPDGDVYVCDFGPTSFSTGSQAIDGAIVRLSPDGSFVQWATGIPDPNFVTVQPDGGLLVSDDFGAVIYQVPPEGGVAETWYTGIESPNGMAYSMDGSSLFVAQTFSSQGGVMSLDSRVWSIPLIGSEAAPGQASLLTTLEANAANDGVAVDQNGYLYVAANVIGKIFRIDPTDGTTSVIAENLPYVASLAFGQGDFSRTSIYATQLVGGNVWIIPVGVPGADLTTLQRRPL